MFSDHKIVTFVSTEANDKEAGQPIQPAISHKEAIPSQTSAIRWYKCQEEAEQPKIILLHQVNNLTLTKYN